MVICRLETEIWRQNEVSKCSKHDSQQQRQQENAAWSFSIVLRTLVHTDLRHNSFQMYHIKHSGQIFHKASSHKKTTGPWVRIQNGGTQLHYLVATNESIRVSAACGTFFIWHVQSSYNRMDPTSMSTFQNQLAWQSVLFACLACFGYCCYQWCSLTCCCLRPCQVSPHLYWLSGTSSHASCSLWHPKPCWLVIACQQESIPFLI